MLGHAAADCQVGGPVAMGDCSFPGCVGRNVVVYVSFPRKFDQTPNVIASLYGVDAWERAGLRLYLGVEHVTPYGFNLRFGTWHDTRMFSAAATWTACT